MFGIGEQVIRKAWVSDYTNGRKGTVVDMEDDGSRYRVRWEWEANGNQCRPIIRTWVKAKYLKPC